MQQIWKTVFTLDDLNARCEGTLISHLGIEFTEIGSHFLKAQMKITPFHLQPHAILHGGASAAFAETIASAAASYAVDPKEMSCVGLELNINHLKAVREGVLTAKTFPYHIGRSTQVWSIEIYDERHGLTAVSRLTVANLKKEI
jgi:1,4-dihydroxy-2-naphthoyl-CoA hydrolase